MADWFDENAPDQQDWFSANAPTPSPTPIASVGPEGGAWFLPRSGAQMDVSEARQAAQQLPDIPFVKGLGEAGLEALPRSGLDVARMVGEAVGGPAVGGIEDIAHTGGQLADLIRGKSLDEVSPPGKPYDEFTGEDWGRLAGQIGLQGIQALPLVGEGLKLPLRAPEPIAAPRVPPDLPPTQGIGPGTTAADVSNALDWTPQSAPVTPLEEAVAKVQPPGPYTSPETGFTHYPGLEDHQPVPSDWAYPVPPPGTPLKGTPLVGPNGSTPAADAAQAQPQGVQQPGPAGFTARKPWEVPPGDEPYAGVTPQPAAPGSQPVGGNVAGFEQVYGAGEVPAGPTLTPEDAWDAAHLRAQLGQSNPYGIVARAKTGAITPAEMGDLIYEHHRLVERAAGLEGTPDYEGAYQAASDFANNVLKPAQNAWHQKGMTMQIAQPVDFSTETGMRNAMDRMNVELKANQASEAKRIVRENSKAKADVNGAEDKLMKAMDKEYSKGEKRAPKTAEQLRAQLAETEPCAL